MSNDLRPGVPQNDDKRCLVLGGCGFLGSVVTRRLVRNGWTVRVFDKEGSDTARLHSVLSRIELVRGDFMNLGDLRGAMEDMPSVLHFIGTTIPQSSMNDIKFDVETNVLPTVRLLELMLNAGGSRLLFASSGGTVYGKTDQRVPIPESHPTNPIAAYGISKLMIEKFIHLFSVNYGLPSVILRFANPYGESQSLTRPQGAVGAFVRSVLQGTPIRIWGDGSVVRDYVYEEDLAESVESVLLNRNVAGVYNVGTGKGTSLTELANTVGRIFAREPKIVFEPGRSFDVPYNVLDVSKIGKATGWKAASTLEDGLKKMKNSVSSV